MIANTYFSTSVRIQYDRGHTVSSGGPYRYIRHPGYLGIIIYLLSTPIILGSILALIPAIVTAILFIIRTSFEDNTLKNKLEGYKEYAEKVKYRLISGVW
jgi:protein-S-isoprenylcysteine O-methyltransferase Ste14